MIQTVVTPAEEPLAEKHIPFSVYVIAYGTAPATTVSGWLPAVDWNFIVTGQTDSGSLIREESQTSCASAIMELRRLTGFTWDQLARLFGVSRRSLHFWASGQSPGPANEERLHRLLATVRKIDRGTASENRLLLFSPLHDGTIPFDLLAADKFDEVISRLGFGPTGARPRPAPLSPEAAALRRPPKPHERVGALQDSVHIKNGRLLSAIPVGTKRGK